MLPMKVDVEATRVTVPASSVCVCVCMYRCYDHHLVINVFISVIVVFCFVCAQNFIMECVFLSPRFVFFLMPSPK